MHEQQIAEIIPLPPYWLDFDNPKDVMELNEWINADIKNMKTFEKYFLQKKNNE